MMKEELLKGLSEEQIAKVRACKNSDELLELAKKEDNVIKFLDGHEIVKEIVIPGRIVNIVIK